MFRGDSFGKPPGSLVEAVLEQVRKIVGSHNAKITGLVDRDLAAQTEHAMMPQIVWGYAIGWDLIELARDMKRTADEVSEDVQRSN
jgi:hypothetical protein